MVRFKDTVKSLRNLVAMKEFPLAATICCLMAALLTAALLHRHERLSLQAQEIKPVSVFPDFASIPEVSVKKQMFFDFVELYIDEQNTKIAAARARLLELAASLSQDSTLSDDERTELTEIAERYYLEELLDNGETDDAQLLAELLQRVDTIPAPLALAQAATESAWGTSRFALQGNNLFGQWCYDDGCGIVPNRRRPDASHEVQAFDSIREAVQAYFMNLNTHERYADFRRMRFQMRSQQDGLDPLVLVQGLEAYSQRGDAYIDEVQTIMQQNDLVEKYSG